MHGYYLRKTKTKNKKRKKTKTSSSNKRAKPVLRGVLLKNTQTTERRSRSERNPVLQNSLCRAIIRFLRMKQKLSTNTQND